MGDAFPHPLQAGGAVRLAEHLPGLRRAQRGEPAEESAADDAVMRGVRLEEERLAHGQRTEFTATARPPEVDFGLGDPRAGSQKPIPLVVRHSYVTSHADIVSLWQGCAGDNKSRRNAAIAHPIQARDDSSARARALAGSFAMSAQDARRLTSQTVAAMSSTDSTSSQPPSIHWNGQNRVAGW
jgi:hypothetical protein